MAAGSPDFPSTQATRIQELLDIGENGRGALRELILESYYHPLVRYCRGVQLSRWRGTERLGDPEELVVEFLLRRTRDSRNLGQWSESTKRLREWLKNGLRLFLRDRLAGERVHCATELPADLDSPVEAPDRAFDREIAWTRVNRVFHEVKADCTRRKQHHHWRAFESHHLQGRSYLEVGEELGLEPRRAERMARTVRERVRESVRLEVRRHVAGDQDVDSEINDLLEALRHDS